MGKSVRLRITELERSVRSASIGFVGIVLRGLCENARKGLGEMKILDDRGKKRGVLGVL